MALTGYEQQLLVGIETRLAIDDPDLDARMRGLTMRAVPRPRLVGWLYAAAILSGVGLALFVVGLLRSTLTVAEVGIGLMVAAPMVLLLPAWRLRQR